MCVPSCQVGAIKLALYLLQSGGVGASALDLCALSGYKFLAAVVVVLFKAFFGDLFGYLAIVLAGANIGTFMAQTMRQSLLDASAFAPGFVTEGMGSPGRTEKKRKQDYSLYAVGLLQPLWFWYLSRV